MIKEGKDFDLLWKMTASNREKCSEEILRKFFDDSNHLMFTEGDNIGLATLEYPGVYNVHWFFEVRGRKAINLAKQMMNNLFDNYGAKAVRGLTPVDNKAARWAARQVGMKSYGMLTYPDGEVNELFCVTKEDFQKEDN